MTTKEFAKSPCSPKTNTHTHTHTHTHTATVEQLSHIPVDCLTVAAVVTMHAQHRCGSGKILPARCRLAAKGLYGDKPCWLLRSKFRTFRPNSTGCRHARCDSALFLVERRRQQELVNIAFFIPTSLSTSLSRLQRPLGFDFNNDNRYSTLLCARAHMSEQ